MGKDFHSLTVFLRVCCTMIHGFHAVGRYMHCVCTHSLRPGFCSVATAESRSFSGVPQYLTSVTSSTFRHFLLSASTFLLLLLPLRLPFLVRSCHRHPPNRILSLLSSKVTPCQVACRFSSPLVFLLLLERDCRLAGQARLLCLFHNWPLTMLHLRDG